MKRFICGVLAGLLGAVCIALGIPMQKNTNTTNAASSTFVENQITNKQDLLAINASSIAGTTSSQNFAPIDKDTKEIMPGNTFTPTPNTYGGQRVSFSVPEFVISNKKSVFMWIYFPETIVFNLTIGFYTKGADFIYWDYNSGQLTNLVNDNGTVSSYGWRLFEFQFENIESKDGDINVNGMTCTSMLFSYETEQDLPASEMEGLSFYHIYLGDNYSKTGIIYHQPFSNFEVKESFAESLEGYYINDDFKLNGIYDVFDYVVVGKYDLKNYSRLEDFTWTIVIKNPSGVDTTIKFGETYTFLEKGWYSINVKLTKNKGNEVVLNTSYTLYCEKFGMGSFSNAKYIFEEKSENVITFTLSEQFVLDGELFVYTSDKKLVEVTNYVIREGVCYVKLKAHKDGLSSVTIEASGRRDGHTELENFQYTATIYIDAEDMSTMSTTIIWVVFGVFCAGFVTFLVISFVKARRFGVK